jgi:hypothetical protein
MNYSIKRQIELDPSTELVLGLFESMAIESSYGPEAKSISRAILLWSIQNKKLTRMGTLLVGQRVVESRYGWEFSDERTAGAFSSHRSGWFIKLNDYLIFRIERDRDTFVYSTGNGRRLYPYQMLKEIASLSGVTCGRLLYEEFYRNNRNRTPNEAALNILLESADASPSCVLVSHGILVKNANDEILGIARLIFAIKLLANQKEKTEKRHEEKQSNK